MSTKNIPKLSKNSNINRMCRTCLTTRGKFRDIRGTLMPSIIESIASVKVNNDDELPKILCMGCFTKINRFALFKKRIERIDKTLRNEVKQRKNIAKKDQQKDTLSADVNKMDIQKKSKNNEFELITYDIDEELDYMNIKDEVELEETVISGLKKTLSPNTNNSELHASNGIPFSNSPPPLVPLEPIDNTNNIKPTTLVELPPLAPLTPTVPSLVPINKPKPTQPEKLSCSCDHDAMTVNASKQDTEYKCSMDSLQCSICQKQFNDKKKLIGHLKGHTVTKDYVCTLCNKRYPNPSTFKVHMRSHTGERPFKCEICNKGFIRYAGVTDHMKTHTDYKPYKCETCERCFKFASNLERHKVLHSGSLPFCCNYCGKTFSQSDNLQLHIRTHHTFEKEYLCNECGKEFVTSYSLNRHMLIHSGYKPYSCEQCPKSYTNANDLKNHSFTHSGGPTKRDKPHACDECGMRFFYACRLRRHKKKHEDKKSCFICSKKFLSYAAAQKHLSKHTQSGRFQLLVDDCANDSFELNYQDNI